MFVCVKKKKKITNSVNIIAQAIVLSRKKL